MAIVVLLAFFASIGFGIWVLTRVVGQKLEFWRTEFQPVRWREAGAVFGVVAAFDFFIYQAHSVASAGFAAFLFVLPLVLAVGYSCGKRWKLLLALTLMLWLTAGRIAYAGLEGSLGAVLCACVLIVLLGAAASGSHFGLLPLTRYVFSSVFVMIPRFFGRYLFAFLHIFRSKRNSEENRRTPYAGIAAVIVPVVVMGGFALIFAFATPELSRLLNLWMSQIEAYLMKWDWPFFQQYDMYEILLWIVLAIVFCGLLAGRKWNVSNNQMDENPEEEQEVSQNSPWYPMYRNTLMGVILIFVSALGYEIYNRLTWNPSVGFCFGTYCHEGAAWLTFALLLTTGLLLLIFRRKTYRDVRIRFLKSLASIWICENLLMACMIYVRLGLYVQQTGLTMLRVVGFFGTTTVAVGILWMARRIEEQQSDAWLFQRYVYTAATLFWLFCVLPIDALVWSYNTKTIQSGNHGPLVHITEQDITPAGLLQMTPLLTSDDPRVRQGASFALRWQMGELSDTTEWREMDYCTIQLRDQIDFYRERLTPRAESIKAEREEFKKYARQFYR